MTRDYLGVIRPKPEDRQDHGVKGMRWGIRRDPAALKAAKAKPAESSGEKNAGIKAATGEETSGARYARLAAQAKSSGAESLSDADIKFFNARTDAVAKVNKMNEVKPGWLKTTTKTVLQQSAQKQMQALADGIAAKYISTPVLDALKGSAAPVAAAAAKSTGTTKPTIKLPTLKGTKIFDTNQYLKDNPGLSRQEVEKVKLKAALGLLDG